jgi:hypothetical protein
VRVREGPDIWLELRDSAGLGNSWEKQRAKN